jgi:hypothetical protein
MAQSLVKLKCTPTLVLLTRPIHLCNTFTPLGELLWFIISNWQARPLTTTENVRRKSERVLSVDVNRLPWWMSPRCALNTDLSSAHSKIRTEAIFIVTRAWTYNLDCDPTEIVNVYPILSWRHRRGVQVNWALDGGGWLTPRPGRFTPRNNPVPIGTGGWVTKKVLLPKPIIPFGQNAGVLIFNCWLSCTDRRWW